MDLLTTDARDIPSPSVSDMAKIIRRAWDACTPAQRESGMHWYDEARLFAEELAEEFGVSLEVSACVVSAYSLNNRWSRNKVQARAHFEGNPSGLGQSIRAAQGAIDHPEDPFSWIVGAKVNPFARAIAGDLSCVATDRHAQRCALGLPAPAARDAKGVNRVCELLMRRKGVRADMIAAYQKVAAQVGVPAACLQAACWVWIRGGAE